MAIIIEIDGERRETSKGELKQMLNRRSITRKTLVFVSGDEQTVGQLLGYGIEDLPVPKWAVFAIAFCVTALIFVSIAWAIVLSYQGSNDPAKEGWEMVAAGCFFSFICGALLAASFFVKDARAGESKRGCIWGAGALFGLSLLVLLACIIEGSRLSQMNDQEWKNLVEEREAKKELDRKLDEAEKRRVKREQEKYQMYRESEKAKKELEKNKPIIIIIENSTK